MKQSGFTLLEVLIALVVFSIGMLGLASLQVMGLKLTADSMERTIATMLANDMIDRMRANVASAKLGINSPYNNPTGAYTANPSCYGLNGTGGYSASAQCSSAQMAANDFADWYASLLGSGATAWRPAVTAALPSAYGVVCVDSTPNDGTPGSPNCDNALTVAGKTVFSIKIWWVERKDLSNPGQLHQYVTSFSL